MRKLLSKPWFVAVLAIGAIVLCTLSLREPSRPNRAKTRRPVVVAPAATMHADAAVERDASPRADGSLQSIKAVLAALVLPANIPDPFERRGAVVVTTEPKAAPAAILPDERESIQLTAVWQQGGVRLALVNNRIVHEGDQLGRLTIDTIGVDGIWITHWKGRDFVAFGNAFTLLTPAGGAPAPAVALHEM
jgi:hypothetical protein